MSRTYSHRQRPTLLAWRERIARRQRGRIVVVLADIERTLVSIAGRRGTPPELREDARRQIVDVIAARQMLSAQGTEHHS